jgi:hypothetical protein
MPAAFSERSKLELNNIQGSTGEIAFPICCGTSVNFTCLMRRPTGNVEFHLTRQVYRDDDTPLRFGRDFPKMGHKARDQDRSAGTCF